MRRIFKRNMIFIASIVGLLLLYILFNLNLFHKAKPLSSSEMDTYLSHVESTVPFKYVADKFDTHSVVFLGEFHKRKQDLNFFNDLIPYLYHTKGIKTIGWEFGAADYQKVADSIVTAQEFDRKKAIAIMRNSSYYWYFEEYLDVFKTIWQLNKTIAHDSDKVRFLQLNKRYIPKRWDSLNDSIRLNERQKNFDNILPEIVKKEVIDKNKKILIYCGLHHSLTKFKTPKFLFLKEGSRAGQILYKKYPDKIFQIWLVHPFYPRWTLYNMARYGNEGNLVYPFDAFFNQLYDTLKRPFAIDAANPAFADLKDYDSFYAFDTFNGIRLKDFCDGAIMLAPFDKIEPVNIIPDWVTNKKELEDVKNIFPENVAKQIKTVQELTNYLNPAGRQKEIMDYHNLDKFWHE